jgi:capsular polysaccharide transport system permease protein
MRKLISRHSHLNICIFLICCVSIYWGAIASDRYVSESNVILESPQIAMPTLSFQSLLSGTGGASGDMLLLRDHLLSVDMLKAVEKKLNFRSHYSDTNIDFFSRLKKSQSTIEELHQYYLKQVSIELDEHAQVLRIKIDAFSPKMANNIAALLLSEGETKMNLMGQRLAKEQVVFLELQVAQLNDKFITARQLLLDYQNANGLVSPTSTVTSLNTVVSDLEAKLSELNTKRTIMTSYQSLLSPNVVGINREINALSQQINHEKSRITTRDGRALNSVSSEYQTLELKAQFAQESYSGALSALERIRIEASRKLKQISILQTPTYPEYPIKPRRTYNSLSFAIISLFITLILHMLLIVIRDHKD